MFTNKSPDEIDSFAIKVIKRFADKESGFPLSVQWFIWDKVARSIRLLKDQTKVAHEFTLLEGTAGREYKFHFSKPNLLIHKLLISFAYSFYLKLIRRLFRKKIIYGPCVTSYTRPFYLDLKNMLNSELIFEGCFKGVGSLRKRYEFRVDASQIEATLHSICREFKSNKLSITDFDRAYLQEQLILQFPYLAQCKQDLLSWKPDLLLLSGCLAPPHVEYVVSAIEQGIKTVMIQHGLDCVHSILDSVPIDAVAVWGEHRADRYRDAGQELDIGITGNPNYDHLRQAEQIHSGGKYLLFTTRPHTPQRCSMPSRWCDEGFLILRALIDSFPNLPIIIKPHPADFVDEYRYIIRDLNLENKVQVSGKKVTELFSESAVVISEDSTVAAEAMIAGRPVVLAQFSGVSPTLPVLEYGAAQISYDKDSLYEHVDRALKFDSRELAILRNNQSDFLSYVVGPLDGNSLSRLSEFLDFLAR